MTPVSSRDQLMSERTAHDELWALVEKYAELVREELADRWKLWPIDLMSPEVHEVIGALVARQVTLATQLAAAPSIWNAHIAPLILRTMTDTYITLAWIFDDPLDRGRKFIEHGLGQQKLYLEHLKAELEAHGETVEENPYIKEMEQWLNSQRWTFLTEVNIGSWSGIDTRKMAEEAGCLDLHRLAYAPFSAAVHSMWNHVGRLNLKTCANPLHRYHRVPCDPPIPVDVDFLYRAAKYVAKTFDLFDKRTGVAAQVPSGFEALVEGIERLGLNGKDESAQQVDSPGEVHDPSR